MENPDENPRSAGKNRQLSINNSTHLLTVEARESRRVYIVTHPSTNPVQLGLTWKLSDERQGANSTVVLIIKLYINKIQNKMQW